MSTTSTEMLQGFELSPQQKRIWKLGQRDGGAAYRSHCVFTVAGELEPGILAMALRGLVERHEVLRTRFELLPGMAQPLQIISTEADFVYTREDVSALPMLEQQGRCAALLEETGETEEQSNGKAVLSVMHLMLNREQHLLRLELSALNADATSLALLGRELSRAYPSILQALPVAAPAVQYVDVSETMNECLKNEEFDIGRQYWREQIASLGQSQLLQERGPSYFKPRVFRTQDADLLGGIPEEFCARLGVSRESLLLASWGLVLSRMQGTAETLISLYCDGRTEDVLLEVIGPLSRPVPFLFRPKAAGSFEEAVFDVHCRLVEISDEQLYFDPVMLNEAPEDDRAYQSCFEFLRMSAHGNGARPAFSLESLCTVTDQYVTKLTAIENAGKLRYQLEYDETRITDGEVRRVWESLRTLIKSGLNDPDRRIELLEVLSAEAKAQAVEYARGEEIGWEIGGVHRMIEVQEGDRPDGVAIVYEGDHLSYEEFDRRGNQLGNYLKRHGVEVEKRVALYLERSVEMMIAMLGVLKSGGVYVPLEPNYPKERLKYMVEEAGALVVLTQERLVAGLPSKGVREICLDKEWEKIREEIECKPEVEVEGDNLAYVIYTSGSSGRPKGVMIPHNSVCNHMRWMQRIHPLGSEDRMLQKTAIGFDAAETEIWLPLLAGGTVVVAREGGQRDVEYLGRVIREEGVTILQVVPTLLSEMLGNEKVLSVDGPLRLVYSGGELLTTELADKFMRTTKAELCNVYGPTEATIDASGWEVRRAERIERVPIGQPITNSQMYVLDREMQLVPIGVTGEMYIGGTAVGRGYLSRADTTAEKYVPNVLGEEGERLYKTGDHGRVTERGELEYLGRIDEQVKMRGYRIELGEIEAVMARLEGVGQCAVVAKENGRGEKQLVGYVVPTGIGTVSIGEIRRSLGEQLPDYMVPAAIVQIEALPLTSNGKLDRKALPGPDFISQSECFVAPQGALEEILCDIWAEVLRVERVGAQDNFFELGGHSLLAMQVISRIRAVLGVELSLRSLFSDPTPADIAVAVEHLQKTGEELSAPPLVRVERGHDLPLSFAQQRLWLLDKLRPGNTAYNISHAVRLDGDLDVNALRKSFNELVRRHEVLRTSFPSAEGQPRLKISPPADFQLEFVDLMNTDESDRRQRISEIVGQGVRERFDLSNGPLFRAKLIRAEDTEHVLVVSVHHIVSDAWSAQIIIREFCQLYEAFSQGLESPLQEPEIQYADYAIWQRSWLQREVLNTHLEYWKKQLDGVAVLEMPTDRPRRAVAGYEGTSEEFHLSADVSEKLRQMSRREGVTLFMSLLAGFQVLLARHSGQTDIAVGTATAGRNRHDTEGLIGLFVNTLVMRVDLGWNPTVKELLTRVRETTLGAYLHQDLPFDMIVEELRPERSLSHQPLFQVMFTLQNVPRETRSMRGIELKNEPFESETAKFELELSMVESGEKIGGTLEYATELFDKWRIRNLLSNLERLLEEMVGDENRRIRGLRLMSDVEWQEVIAEWIQTAAEYPRDKSLHHLIDEQVGRTPDAVAAVYEGGHLSYDDLNQRANQVGDYLRRAGVAPESVVAVGTTRSLEFLVSMLGVFKAGGTYLPLDLRLPAARLQHSLAESKTRLVLTTKEFAAALESTTVSAGFDVPIRSVEELQASLEFRTDNVPPTGCPNNLAYVIYTSGSTGTPKGAMVEQEGMINHLFAKVRDLTFTGQDIIAQTASQAFDISVWQFLISLLVGGKVVIVSDEKAHDPVRLIELFEEEEVTVAEAVPSLLPALLAELTRGTTSKSAAALRWLLVTGEAFPSELCRRWLSALPDAQVMNAYGPTECSDDVTHCKVASCPESHAANVALGRPVPNIRIYILDEMFTPVPPGVAGEICVGGIGVGRGYVEEPQKTAQSYIPDPFGATGIRLYRTGDLGRFGKGGEIEYLGRIDQQVKVRGYRVELGEIEAALNEHSAVERAVVVAREDQPGEKRLVAYVVKTGLREPSYEEDLNSSHRAVVDWGNVFEEVYADQAHTSDRTLVNPRVWVNSYTDRPLPVEEALACVEDSVERILALQPRRMLEIGCGTGLILSRVAPHCENYYGTDISAAALSQLGEWLTGRGFEGKVTLLQQAGDDFSGIPRHYFDLVVINEVVQYFPSIQYLLRILEQVPDLITAESSIFLGGIRNLELLDALRASVEVSRAPGLITLKELRQRIDKNVRREKELLLAPGFFARFKEESPWIQDIEIQLKGGLHVNELVKYRYDATLYVGSAWRDGTGRRCLEWQNNDLSLNSLRQILTECDETLEIDGIPNSRVGQDAKILKLLAEEPGDHSLEQLRKRLQEDDEPYGVSPQQLWELGREIGRRVQLSWPGSGSLGAFRAIFQRQVARRRVRNGEESPIAIDLSRDWHRWDHYANRPLQEVAWIDHVAQWREHLSERLPEYMVPAVFVEMEQMPLTANGKIDRRALPRPVLKLEAQYTGPQSQAEEVLCGIWAEVLGVERVGIHDNFFDLGGNSLSAFRVISRIRKAMGVEATLLSLFETGTISEFAKRIDGGKKSVPHRRITRVDRNEFRAG